MPKNTVTIIVAFLFSTIAILTAYIALGLLSPALVFTFGFIGGFIIWLFINTKTHFNEFQIPYFLTLLLLVFHKIEERKMNFFPELSEITGISLPNTSYQLLAIVYSIEGSWLLIPCLLRKQYDFGYYLAWTFFTSMGITELIHFIIPLILNKHYVYFPGMASGVFLVPVAWWGIYKLSGIHE